MGDFLLRKCDVVGGGTTGEEGMLPALLPSAPTSAGSKRRTIPLGAEEEEASSAQICDKRKKRTAWSPLFCSLSLPPSSSVHVVPRGSVVDHGVVSSRCSSCSNSPSSAAAVGGEPDGEEEEEESAPREKHAQGLAAVCAEEQGESLRRLNRRLRSGITASGKLSGDGGEGIVDSSSAPSSSSSSSGLEDDDGLAAVEFGELESTTANTAQGSGRTAPSAAARTRPVRIAATAVPDDEIEVFFAKAEEDLATKFADKYNYDIVKDTPLEGRYEWVRIEP